jgi:ketosteroid isomerase-like protein
MITLAILAAATVAGAPPSAVYTQIPADLRAAAESFDRAQVEGDRAALERVVADDFTLVSGGGNLQAKAAFVADFTAPGFRLDPFVIREPVEKVWGDGAVLGGLVDFEGVEGGKRFSTTFRFADVWARRGGRWQVIHAQVTRLPDAPAKP